MIVVERIVGEDLNLGTGDVTVTHPGGGTLQGTQISLSTFARLGPAATSETRQTRPGTVQPLQTFTFVVPDVQGGAELGDYVIAVLYPVSVAGSMMPDSVPVHICFGFVSMQNEITVVVFNPTPNSISFGDWVEIRWTIFRMR